LWEPLETTLTALPFLEAKTQAGWIFDLGWGYPYRQTLLHYHARRRPEAGPAERQERRPTRLAEPCPTSGDQHRSASHPAPRQVQIA
jgi:hypothetical protein